MTHHQCTFPTSSLCTTLPHGSVNILKEQLRTALFVCLCPPGPVAKTLAHINYSLSIASRTYTACPIRTSASSFLLLVHIHIYAYHLLFPFQLHISLAFLLHQYIYTPLTFRSGASSFHHPALSCFKTFMYCVSKYTVVQFLPMCEYIHLNRRANSRSYRQPACMIMKILIPLNRLSHGPCHRSSNIPPPRELKHI